MGCCGTGRRSVHFNGVNELRAFTKYYSDVKKREVYLRNSGCLWGEIPPPFDIARDKQGKKVPQNKTYHKDKLWNSEWEIGSVVVDLNVTESIFFPANPPGGTCEIDDQYRRPFGSARPLFANFSSISIAPDDQYTQVQTLLEEKDKKIEELVKENEKLKAESHIKRISLQGKPHRLIRGLSTSSDRMHNVARSLMGDRLRSSSKFTISGDEFSSENECVDSVTREKIKTLPFKHSHSTNVVDSIEKEKVLDSLPLKFSRSLGDNIISTYDSENNGKWSCSELMIL